MEGTGCVWQIPFYSRLLISEFSWKNPIIYSLCTLYIYVRTNRASRTSNFIINCPTFHSLVECISRYNFMLYLETVLPISCTMMITKWSASVTQITTNFLRTPYPQIHFSAVTSFIIKKLVICRVYVDYSLIQNIKISTLTLLLWTQLHIS